MAHDAATRRNPGPAEAHDAAPGRNDGWSDPSTAYTIHDTVHLRQSIDSDLQRIVTTVRAGDPRLVSLVLTGGFARGEGAVIGDRPQNDYDLVAVRRAGPSRRSYAEMRSELEDALGLHIDLAPAWRARLRFASPSIFWYETALRGRVLWGDHVLKHIPVREPTRIAPDEGLRLLVNRAAGLLLASGPSDHDRRIQASKALLGALDARMLAAGHFPPSHRERWALYEKLCSDGDDLGMGPWRQELAWAFAFKTQPETAKAVDARRMWQIAADAVLGAVPVALQHAGIADLERYSRRDRWPERLHYWWSAGRVGARRRVAHPTSQVRAGTLQLLAAMRDDEAATNRFERLMPSSDPLEALDKLRQVTWQ